MLFNAFIQGLFVGAITASVTVVVYLIYIKITDKTQIQT
jgi:uncharacterized membrane protein